MEIDSFLRLCVCRCQKFMHSIIYFFVNTLNLLQYLQINIKISIWEQKTIVTQRSKIDPKNFDL